MNAFHQKLGKRLRDIREQAGLTQQELARMARITRPYLVQIELGRRERVSAEVVFRLAGSLRCSLDELVDNPVRPHRRGSKHL